MQIQQMFSRVIPCFEGKSPDNWKSFFVISCVVLVEVEHLRFYEKSCLKLFLETYPIPNYTLCTTHEVSSQILGSSVLLFGY